MPLLFRPFEYQHRLEEREKIKSMSKDEKLAIELLRRGACPDAKDAWGPTLTQAVRAQYERLAVILVEYGANPRVNDAWGSILSQSMRHNLRTLVAILINAGVLP